MGYKTSEFVKKISENIRKAKVKKKISYGEIARRSGVNLSTIEKIIYPQIQDVQVSTLKEIARVLDVTVDSLIG